MMAVVEAGQQRAGAKPERRTRLNPRRHLRTVTSATAPAATTEQLYPRHDRTDWGQVDTIVTMSAAREALDTVIP
ncbi:hypothetical protein NI18_08215 [Sphingomonas sp. Ant20]|nr:hypothetical protein NI18_08215 [Sphingomonas sp. Ant20]